MQLEEGISYPRGGTRAVPEALAALGRDLGVRFQLGAHVDQITVEGNRVSGLRLKNGTTLAFDAIISNSDAVRTHDELLPENVGRTFRRRRKYEPACSGVVLYLGLNKRYRTSPITTSFSPRPDEEFD